MQKNTFTHFCSAVLFGCATFLSACNQKTMSVFKADEQAGFNGSFEYSKDGLPVNWQLYTAQTVPWGDFEISLDTSKVKSGRQSLKFEVRACDTTGGWYSPGMASQIPAKAGEQYRISFWLMNEGGRFRAKVAGVAATSGDSQIMVESSKSHANWTYYEYRYTIPAKMNTLRFEFNGLSLGTFWLDDVRLEKMP